MKIIITIKNGDIEISLKDRKKLIAEVCLPDKRDLGEKLLPTIDKMLKKNRLFSKDINSVEVQSDQSDSFTTTRIAKTFAKAFNWANKS